MTGQVRHIDHVLVRADDTVDLWGVLTRDLQLPIAWRGGLLGARLCRRLTVVATLMALAMTSPATERS